MLRLQTGCQSFFDRPILSGPPSAEAAGGEEFADSVGESAAIKVLLDQVRPASEEEREKPLLILGGPGAGKKRLAKKLFQSRIAPARSFLDIAASAMEEDAEEEAVEEQLFNGSRPNLGGPNLGGPNLGGPNLAGSRLGGTNLDRPHHAGLQNGAPPRSKPTLSGPQSFLENFEGAFVFIKRIDSLTAPAQFKLLKILKSEEYRETEADGKIRLTASANADLPEKAEKGLFCQELFRQFSLCRIPDLKDRSKEIPRLVRFFLKRNHFKGKAEPEALKALSRYEWRGNVGELKKVCVRLSAVCSDKESIALSDLPSKIKRPCNGGSEFLIQYSPSVNLQNLKNLYIKLAVDHFKCKKKAAAALGISVKTIYNKGII